jgi:hypothetical protein
LAMIKPPFLKKIPIERHEPDQWIEYFDWLLRNQTGRYRQRPGSKNVNQVTSYEEFFRIVYKYHDQLKLAVFVDAEVDLERIEEDASYVPEIDLEFVGQTLKTTALDKKCLFIFDLTAARADGVQPDQFVLFANDFGLNLDYSEHQFKVF